MIFKEHIKGIERDSVVISCGLPATCKSGLAAVLSRSTGHVIVATDMLRLEIMKGHDIFSESVASDMRKRSSVYDEMFYLTDRLCHMGYGVVMDATFIKQELRVKGAEIANTHRRSFYIFETDCSEHKALLRISRRSRDRYDSNAITDRAYFNNKSGFEGIDINHLKELFPLLSIIHLRIDTESDDSSEWKIIRFQKY
ncbi:MAG TPA: hypothetical protein ENF54_04115 [Desulfobacteraceae bacterium]|nr:hypothetical protein [Desulfobacteraceae bacterium]